MVNVTFGIIVNCTSVQNNMGHMSTTLAGALACWDLLCNRKPVWAPLWPISEPVMGPRPFRGKTLHSDTGEML